MTERAIEGFLREGTSDGEYLCTGCWDNSDHDTDANNDIPHGASIYWRCTSTMYDSWDAYCESCAASFALGEKVGKTCPDGRPCYGYCDGGTGCPAR